MKDPQYILFTLAGTFFLAMLFSPNFARSIAKLLSVHAKSWESCVEAYRANWNASWRKSPVAAAPTFEIQESPAEVMATK